MNQDDETTKGQPNETSNFFGEMLGYILIAAPFIASTAIVGFQVYIWLRSGSWPKISVLDGLKYLSNNQWLVHPTDWTGLHSMLSDGALSAALFLIGIAMVWMADFD